MAIEIKKHMGLLGLRVKDRVTGYEGVAASIAFDLYGCVQAVVNPGMDKEGKLKDQMWFDVNRLIVLDKKPVMAVPDFEYGSVAEGRIPVYVKGAAEKPAMWKC